MVGSVGVVVAHSMREAHDVLVAGHAVGVRGEAHGLREGDAGPQGGASPARRDGRRRRGLRRRGHRVRGRRLQLVHGWLTDVRRVVAVDILSKNK